MQHPHNVSSVKIVNFPTFLTLFRLILSPLLLPLFLVIFLPYKSYAINLLLASLFLLFGITDFLDGYLARKYRQETWLGKVLDPIADKFLMFSTLVTLLALGRIYFYWVIIIIGREFFVMGLREVALAQGFSVSVNGWGKVKTVFQMFLCILLILGPFEQLGYMVLEKVALGITLILTVYSAALYYGTFIRQKPL